MGSNSSASNVGCMVHELCSCVSPGEQLGEPLLLVGGCQGTECWGFWKWGENKGRKKIKKRTWKRRWNTPRTSSPWRQSTTAAMSLQMNSRHAVLTNKLQFRICTHLKVFSTLNDKRHDLQARHRVSCWRPPWVPTARSSEWLQYWKVGSGPSGRLQNWMVVLLLIFGRVRHSRRNFLPGNLNNACLVKTWLESNVVLLTRC